MLLRECLEEYTKEQLIAQAKSFELENLSGLRKKELIDRILDCFCEEERLRSRLACLTNEQMILFRKACDTPQVIPIHEILNSMQMCKCLIGNFDKITDKFSIYEEIASVFKQIDDEAFRADQLKKGWMIQCMAFFMNYYGVAPLEVIYKLYKLKVKDSIDEMIAMLWNMPMDIMESCIIPMMGLKSKVLSKNNPIYSSRGLLVHMPILTNNQLDSLLNIQKDIPFYIPTVKQIEELGTIAYEESSSAYVNLKSFFMKKLGIPNELAISWCLNIWANSYEGKSSSEIIDKLLQRNIVFQNEKQMDDFKLLLLDAHNSVRKIENRGYTFTELLKRKYV